MCLKLSEEEMAKLAHIANQRGVPKVGVIRQWIHEADQTIPMSDSARVMQALLSTFKGRVGKP
jgi:hypothetical protein